MNQKLKKIAHNLVDTVEDFEKPQNVYDRLLSLANTHLDYFSVLGAESIIKLTFLIYSLKKTNNFELGEKMINDTMFLFVLFSEGDNYRTICDMCGGDGENLCGNCDGEGETPCEECDATGEITCDTCYGSGIDPDNEEESCWDCNGAGVRTCPSCDGYTMENCTECYGRRTVNCDECDAIGQLETDEWLYEIEAILTWDLDFISTSIKDENTLVPIMSLNRYYKRQNYIVIKYIDEEHTEFKKGFRANEIYCFGHNDNPDIKLTPQGIAIAMPFKNLKNYD